jgi:hypothetical protein
MHLLLVKRAPPPSLTLIAPVGQTCAQVGSMQLRQISAAYLPDIPPAVLIFKAQRVTE